MASLRKVRVQLIDKVTKLPQEDVDVITSADCIYFPDGETFQDKWEKGEFKGEEGEPGEDGANATIKVGKVYMIDSSADASVINTGTMTSAVLDFYLPKGEDGTSIKILGRFDNIDLLNEAYPDGTDIDGGFLIGPEDYPARYYYWNKIEQKWTSMGSIKGDKGDKGDSGEDGRGLEIADSFDTVAELLDTYPDGSVCDGRGCVIKSTGEYWYWNTKRAAWASIGNVVGLQGPKGDQGESATIEIGVVNTISHESRASVYNAGTASNARLCFNIPRGEPGKTPVIDSEITPDSSNPVEGSAIYEALENKAPAAHSHTYAGSEFPGGSAKRAVADEDGNNIKTYAKSLSIDTDTNSINLLDNNNNIISSISLVDLVKNITNNS